jgi:peptidyl-prolyl cis-trans isomerase SurA
MRERALYSGFILIWCLLFLPPAQLLGRVIEQVVTVIDGEPYTVSSLRDYAQTKLGREFPKGDLNRIETEDKEVLEQFITEKLLAAEVKQAGIRIRDEEIDQYIAQVKQRNQLSNEDLSAALSREGMTLEAYRASIRAEIEKSEMISRQVLKKVNITSDDVERYYRLNTKQFMSPEKVRLRHILISLPQGASAEDEREALRKAAELRSRAEAGEEFSKLAAEHSEGGGAAGGGDIGWVRRGSLLKEIEDVAFSKLTVGEISPPVRTSLGVHLVKLEGREVAQPLPLAEVQGRIKEELFAKAREERFQNWLKGDLRRKHRVDVKIPGVVFRPEETKEKTVDSLMASSASKRSRNEDSGFLGYLNPLSYIFSTKPIEGEDAEGESSARSIVSVLGVPLFTTDTGEDVPKDPLAPITTDEKSGQKSQESGGFFSSVWKTLNPFSE